jgi:hypothetical protein
MTDDNRQTVADRVEPIATKRRRGRLRRWLFLTASVAFLAIATFAIAGKVYLDRVEARFLFNDKTTT